jgi:hypothetical protein
MNLSRRSDLETARLRLRILCPGDEVFLAALDSDPVVMEHIQNGAISYAKALKYAQCEIELSPLKRWTGTWLVELREDRVALGWVQLSKLSSSGRDDLQLGYEFAPVHGAGDMQRKPPAACWNTRSRIFSWTGLQHLPAPLMRPLCAY